MSQTTAGPTTAGRTTAEPAAGRRRSRGLWVRVIKIVLLAWVSFIMLAPFMWAVSTSLRLPSESLDLPPRFLPTSFDLDSYRDLFARIHFPDYFLNSLVVTAAIVAGQVLIAAFAGYAFARLTFPGKRVLFALTLATLMVPLQATIIPIFLMMSRLSLVDTLWALILPAWPTAFGAFLMRQYFLRLPKEWDEAARLDGASSFGVFWRIYLPLAKPPMATVAMLAFNFHWNEFFRPLILINTEEKFTLPLGLVSLQGTLGGGSISVVLAGVVLSFLPVFLVFIFAQRYLIDGVTAGGIQ